MESDADTVEAAVAHGLEMQRGVGRIGFELSEALVGNGLDRSG